MTTPTTDSLVEIQRLFPRCPFCGYRTSVVTNRLVIVRPHELLRVAHQECAQRLGFEAVAA